MAQQARLAMGDRLQIASIGQSAIDGFHETAEPIGLTQEKNASVGDNFTATGFGLNATALDRCKTEREPRYWTAGEVNSVIFLPIPKATEPEVMAHPVIPALKGAL